MASKRAKPGKSRPELDAARDVVGEVLEYAFECADLDDVAERLSFVDKAAEELASSSIAIERGALVTLCAELAELDVDALRRADDARLKKRGAAKQARGGPAELEALGALRPKKGAAQGRFGRTFDDVSAATLAKAWARIDRAAFGKTMFGDLKDLDLVNFGALSNLSGLEAATEAKSLKLRLTPHCDLAALAGLLKLRDLELSGKLEGFGAIAGPPKLTSLKTEANERGIRELAALPSLRMLKLTVADDVPLGGLGALRSLEMLALAAGKRNLDASLTETMAALAKRKIKLSLYEHEGWPTQLDLPKRVGSGFVQINMG